MRGSVLVDTSAWIDALRSLVAACASHHGLSLLHHDDHFDRIDRALGHGDA